MRRGVLLGAISFALAGATAHAQGPQPPPPVGPPFAEVETAWTAFWTRLAEGDLAGAWRYLHSSRRYAPSGDTMLAMLQDLAHQMAFCRLEPSSAIGDGDNVMYLVKCQHGSETAERLVILRRDSDGVWRLIPF